MLAPAAGRLSETGKPIFTGPTEMFGLVVGLAIKGGLVAALPVFVYNVYRVARRFLSRQQRRTVLFFLCLILCFYLAGTAFAYFVLLPIGLGFLLQFGTDIATPMIRMSEYMELAMAMLFWLGLVFELPVVMLLLAKLRVVSHRRFRRLRGHFAIAALILGMVITPTVDFVNQTLVAVPIMVLYEVGLSMAWLAEGGDRAVVRIAKTVVVGVGRRLLIAVVIAPALALGLVYVIALGFLFFWDGHLSTTEPSKAKAWLDRAYRRALEALATWL